MNVVHVSFEVAPIYKTGGLGDVVGSLPKALTKLGVEASVAMPEYAWLTKKPDTLPHSQVPIHYIKNPFFTEGLKTNDHKLQARAFAAFAFGVLEELKRQKIQPDIIHCHDWHAALIPLILKKQPDSFFEKTKTMLSIHNIGFQGNFNCSYFDHPETKKMLACTRGHKRISFLKEGIEHADFITTVSPNHAREIRNGKASFGLKSAIAKKRGKFIGILNGIDYDIWNPRTDTLIKHRYNKTNVLSQKAKNKLYLQKKLGLEDSVDIPLYGFIARLTEQKGLDILIPLLESIPRQRLQVVILGSGQEKFERKLLEFKKHIDPRWYSVNVAFDEQLAHEIYAASDFFLIPSVYEPCGLTQMIAMAFGSIPIATPVGGLEDTIMDAITGFLTEKVSSDSLGNAIERASDLWENTKDYKRMVEQVMDEDFSWEKSAKEYVKTYHHVSVMR